MPEQNSDPQGELNMLLTVESCHQPLDSIFLPQENQNSEKANLETPKGQYRKETIEGALDNLVMGVQTHFTNDIINHNVHMCLAHT